MGETDVRKRIRRVCSQEPGEERLQVNMTSRELWQEAVWETMCREWR